MRRGIFVRDRCEAGEAATTRSDASEEEQDEMRG